MIHYQLRCDREHAFDGWFRDSAGFDKQAAAGLVECPICASSRVQRALMAPAIPRKGRTAATEAAPAEAPPAPPALPPQPATSVAVAAAGPMPAQLVALLRHMRAQVEKHCDYVGPGFAEEARKQARGDAPERGIYGEASPEEAEALRDEGIDIAQIPWVPPADS